MNGMTPDPNDTPREQTAEEFAAQNKQPQDGSVEPGLMLPEGCVALRSIEVVQFLDESGDLAAAIKWQGTGDLVAELGLLEWGKLQIAAARANE